MGGRDSPHQFAQGLRCVGDVQVREKEGQCFLGVRVEKYLYWRNRFGTQYICPQAGTDPHFVELNKLLRAQFKKNITYYKCKIIHNDVHLRRAMQVRDPGVCFIGVMETHLVYMHF